MPIYEHDCPNESCLRFHKRFERFFHSQKAEPPPCDSCGVQTTRLISRFIPVWCQPLSAYSDKTLEYANQDGFFATRRGLDGKMSRHYIDSFQGIKEHAKATGAYDPRDLPGNIQGVDSSGMDLVTGNVSEI